MRRRVSSRRFTAQAKVAQIRGLSAHAGRSDLLRWIGALKTPPRRVFLTHGEADAADALASEIRSRWNYDVEVPEYRSTYELD